MTKPTVSFRLSQRTREQIAALAERRGCSGAEVVTLAVESIFNKETRTMSTKSTIAHGNAEYVHCNECQRERQVGDSFHLYTEMGEADSVYFEVNDHYDIRIPIAVFRVLVANSAKVEAALERERACNEEDGLAGLEAIARIKAKLDRLKDGT